MPKPTTSILPADTPRVLSVPSLLYLIGCSALLMPQAHAFAHAHKPLYTAYLFALSFLGSAFLGPVVIWLGYRLGIVDSPNEARKLHARPTPLTGGVAIYAAFAITILINFNFSVEMKAVLVAGTMIFVMGLLDDWFGLSARVRLMVQIGAVIVLVNFGVRVTFVPDYLGGIVVETIITIIWIVGITNSMNFIDGMDGIAAGTCVVCAGFFAIVALMLHQPFMMFLAIALAGSSSGFLIYNFRGKKPAQLFMGDSGSTFLGFLLASFAILGDWGDSVVDLIVPILIMCVLIFDMSLTTLVRLATGKVKSFSQWIHYTGRDHFHHRLTGLGLGKTRATLLYLMVSAGFGMEAIVILYSNVWVSLIVLAHSILAFVIIGMILVPQDSVQQPSPRLPTSPESAEPVELKLPA